MSSVKWCYKYFNIRCRWQNWSMWIFCHHFKSTYVFLYFLKWQCYRKQTVISRTFKLDLWSKFTHTIVKRYWSKAYLCLYTFCYQLAAKRKNLCARSFVVNIEFKTGWNKKEDAKNRSYCCCELIQFHGARLVFRSV